MQKIYLYNTATRTKEEFKPLENGKVGIYSCGPTVYWDQHVGNMYAYLFADVMVRTLKYFGYEVNQVMNLTDVGALTSDADTGDDKMEVGAKREGLTVWDVAKKYEKQFFESEELLNISRPNTVCAATAHIKEQIELIQKIEKNGFCYKTSDGIYFDTSKYTDYAKFANLKLESIKYTDREEINKEKRNLSDFALWKFSPSDGKRQMEWDSPWGVGFPGWHIECTAMSVKYLGEHFDIHTGGIDHIPVHHTNEIAQGYGAFGHQTANFWIHNAWVMGKGGAKMSKSLGNIFTAQELVEMGIDPLGYRYLFLTTHYRKGMEFSLESLKTINIAYQKLKMLVSGWPGEGKVDENYQKVFEEKIADDLGMPEVMALVWKLVKDEKVTEADKKATLIDFDRVLGLKLGEEKVEEKIPEEIVILANMRLEAKKNKNYNEADGIRTEIEKKGYLIEDTDGGYKIKVAI
ncbi:cysteine--tRNA ligase [Candidatus Shapirobacteria bacterium]|nr:cysteine--tRNA ligase [Candidatus Shapirobacteria bacterium]